MADNHRTDAVTWTRWCNQCRSRKSLDDFVCSKNSKYGRGYICTPCVRKRSNLRRRGLIKPKEKRIDIDKQIQLCSRCNQWKSFSEYPPSKRYPSGLHCWCVPCKKEYHKIAEARWRANNKERIRDRVNNPRNKEKRKLRSKKYRELNREKIREYHRQNYKKNSKRMRAVMDRWRARNLDKWNGYGRKRRSIMNGGISEPYSGDEIYNRDQGICGICKEHIDKELRFPNPKSFSVDHIVPVILGGNDTPNNVQAAHFGCNAAKAHHVRT